MNSLVPPSPGAIATPPVHNLVRTRIPTRHGEFTLHYYLNDLEQKEHLALVMGEVRGAIDVPVRVHSECLTGDVFGSMRCDCGDQLDRALQLIGKAGRGVLVYLRQEGRGIGLLKKLQAYNLQDQGLDTVEANLRLGHRGDERDYGIAASILADLGIGSVRLITNNPRKITELRGLGVDVTERIPIEVPFNAENEGYLRTKARKMQHLLSLEKSGGAEFVFLDGLVQRLASQGGPGKVFVSLSFAQSLDGVPLPVPNASGGHQQGFRRLARYLASLHDGVLTEVGNLPSGPSGDLGPVRRVIIDENLDYPADSGSLANLGRAPVLVAGKGASPEKRALIRQLGGEVVTAELGADGTMDFPKLLSALGGLGLRSLLLDRACGAAEQLLSARLADYCIIAVSPEFQGQTAGTAPPANPGLGCGPRSIADCHYHLFEQSIIVHGALERAE